MKKHMFLLSYLFIYLFISCNTSKNLKIIEFADQKLVKNSLSETEILSWLHKDIFNDSIPGISLEKAYRELLPDKKEQEVVVAVIDTEVDIYHEDLKDQIWNNPNEIAKNGLDDDQNGYIDDIYGWNFLGNDNGENVIYSNYEYIRMIRKFAKVFEGKDEKNFSDAERKDFETYNKLLSIHEKKLTEAESRLLSFETYLKRLTGKQDSLKLFFSLDTITKENLSALQTDNDAIESLRKKVIEYIDMGYSEKATIEYIVGIKKGIKRSANIEYKEREILGDNPDDITDTDYGNNNVSGNLDQLYHGTLITGIIAAKRNNQIGINGIVDSIKIMPLCVSANGDEHDKDIALAIRYAVDNGAKVINMSSGKSFSMQQEWVNSAIKYAENNDVLFITSAGNGNLNLDIPEIHYYPNNNTKASNSFLMVGASSYFLKDGLKNSSTNYGKENVDIFAPGNKIYTTNIKNTYKFTRGTSIATSIVSGVAALIRSYYPNLKAYQVKEILMTSGVSYNINTEIKAQDGTKKTLPFSELSKSGKVVNAYNALLMAERLAAAKE